VEVALFKVRPLRFKAVNRIYSTIQGTLALVKFMNALSEAVSPINRVPNLEVPHLLAKSET